MENNHTIKSDSIKKNFFYQSLYQVLSLILPFITAPYLARVLGTTGTGVYSYTSSIVTFFTLFACLGISNYGNREIAGKIDDKYKLSKTFWGIFVCHFFITLVSIILYTLFILLFEDGYRVYFFCLGLQLIATLFDITWFFSGIQKFKITVRRNLIIRIISVICVFVFVKESSDLWIYLLILSVGNLLGQMVVWVQLKKYIIFTKINTKEIFQHLKPLIILFIPVIAISVYRYMDKIMIPIFSTIEELGLYENTEKIITLPLSLITTIGLVMLPKMSSMEATDNEFTGYYIEKGLKYSIILCFAITGGLMGIGKVFAPVFFGEEFSKCGFLIPIMAFCIPLLTLSNSIRSLYLIPKKKDSAFIIAAFSGAIINLLLNFILISKLGALGAICATIATELVVCAIHVLFSYKEIHFLSILRSIVPFFLVGFLMAVGVQLIGLVISNSIVCLIIQVSIGTIFYISATIIILSIQKDDFIKEIENKIKKRFKRNPK